jgi:adenylate cyclase class IV
VSGSLPADELELKARVEDATALRRRLVAAGARLEFRGEMLDRRLDRDGALAARDEVLRVRVYQPAEGGVAYGLLSWKGPVGARAGYRHRAEMETRVAEPEALLAVLERLGFAISLRIDRTVEVYRLGGAVLRLEWYPEMDVLLEVEGAPDEIERAIAVTGLPRARFLPESLPYFSAAYEARTGRPALLVGKPAR